MIVARHNAVTRLTHWINVLAIAVLLMSGLQILIAHPRLYWGEAGTSADPALIEFAATGSGSDRRGVTRIGNREFDTTGVLGLSFTDGVAEARGFPAWATLPGYRDLATGRRWHFFFAWVFVVNGLLYLGWNLVSGHVRRDLLPTRAELRLRHIWHEIKDHARLRWPVGEADTRYNILQKITYLKVLFLLLPLVVLTGLSMSPGFNAVAPWLPDLFGGRQSARTLHFVAAALIVAFILLHVGLVLLSGPWNLMRSMVTGRYRVRPETEI